MFRFDIESVRYRSFIIEHFCFSRWDAGLEECRTGWPQNKSDSGQEGRIGQEGLQDKRDTGQEGQRTGGMQDRSDEGKKGCKEMRDSGK